MKNAFRLSRRRFLQLSAMSGGSLALTSLLGAPAQARSAEEAAHAQASLNPFTPLPSQLAFGQPADVAMGWDGVLWAIDQDGTPYAYDPIRSVWDVFGSGVDAATWGFGGQIIFFRNGEWVALGGPAGPAPTPQPISQLWSKAPASFQLGVNGVAATNKSTYLFKGGLFAAIDDASPRPVTDLKNWPKTANWRSGVIDVIGSFQGDAATALLLIKGNEMVTVNMAEERVTLGPLALTSFFAGELLALLRAGKVNALLFAGDDLQAPVTAFAGAQVLTFATAQSPQPSSSAYVASAYPAWPATWNPRLVHAPSGYANDLWAVTTDGALINSDGENFVLQPLPGSAPAMSISVGVDGVAFAASSSTVYRWSGADWTPAGAAPFSISQISAGDEDHVWVRSNEGTVYRLSGGAFTAVSLGVGDPLIDIAAGQDGTVWASAGGSSAFRYTAQGTAPAEAIALPAGATSALRISGVSFGAGLFLAQQGASGRQVLRYTSPYRFRTLAGYEVPPWTQIEQGMSRLFMVTQQATASGVQHIIVALDQQGGQLRGQAAPVGPGIALTAPVFDPANRLLYVGAATTTAEDVTTPGSILALDAHTLQVVWRYETVAGVDAPPNLSGNRLCAADRAGRITMFDAFAAAQQSATGVAAKPIWQVNTGLGAGRMQTPILADGGVYAVGWSAASGGALFVYRCNAADGSGLQIANQRAVPGWSAARFAPVAPKWGRATFAGTPAGQPAPALLIHAYDQVLAASPTGAGWAAFAPHTGADYFSSDMTYRDGVLYVGDSTGRLFALDASLTPIFNTPVAPQMEGAVRAAPLLEYDDLGNVSAVSYVTSNSADSVLAEFRPTAGVINLIPLAQNVILALSKVVTNGLIYAAGAQAGGALGQVFAVKSGLATVPPSGFVIEAQLMQDYDEAPSGAPDSAMPPAYARYQTQVTLVAGQNAARPFESVKIWTDEPATIAVDGQGFNTGPFTPALVQADASGTLVVTSGYLSQDGSDATDMYAVPLRLWATFMEPFERVVIYPDRAFHYRLSQASADPSNDDPDTINLATTTDYNGATLLPRSQASQMRTAIQTTYSSAPLPPLAGGKYLAHDTLCGASYFPANTSATTPVSVTLPAAYVIDEDGAYAAQAVAAATVQIDQLEGAPFSATAGVSSLALGSIGDAFKDAWRKIKSGAATLKKIIISFGREIYIGLQILAEGELQVLRGVINRFDAVAIAIGAFFVKLGKAIESVIQALSILFNFEEFIKTHRILKALVQTQIDSLVSRMTAGQNALDTFFGTVEADIAGLFCDLKNAFDPGICPLPGRARHSPARAHATPIGNLPNVGATPSTAFNTSSNANKPGASRAAQCTWLMHKARQNCRSASAGGAPSVSFTQDDPLTAFFTAFAQSLRANPELANALQQTQQDFLDTFKVKSASQFLQMAMVDLLDLIEDLLIGSLAVTQALFDGLGTLAQALHDAFFGADGRSGGLMNTTLRIPVVSTLYKALTGDDLTFLDLMLLMAAIPVTLLFRVVEGRYPSQVIGVQAQSGGLVGANVASDLGGLLEGVLLIGLAIFAPIADASGEIPIINNIAIGLGVAAVLSEGLVIFEDPSGWDDMLLIANIGALALPYLFKEPERPVVNMFVGALLAVLYGFQYRGDAGSEDVGTLVTNLLSDVPTIAQILALEAVVEATDDLSPILLGGIDMVCYMAAGAASIVETIAEWGDTTSPPPRRNRLYLPWISARP